MKLNRLISENDLQHKGFPFECLNCGNKPIPQKALDNHGDCEICGDTITAYTVDTAEIILKFLPK